MKYIFLNDFKLIVGKNKKIILLYFLVFSMFLTLGLFNYEYLNEEFVIRTLGLSADRTDVIGVMIFLFHTTFYVYISVLMFTNDLRSGQSNIFLRIDTRKWLIYKIVSAIIIGLTIEIIVLASLTGVLFFKNAFSIDFIKLFLINLAFIVSIISLGILSYINKFCLVFVLGYFYLFSKVEYILTSVNVLYYLGMIVIFNFLSLFLIRYQRCKVFEDF